MGNDIIQADYNALASVASRFGNQARSNQELLARVRQAMQPLESGGWQGRGSAAFFNEMNGQVLPAVQRLTAALDQARSVTLDIARVVRLAECYSCQRVICERLTGAHNRPTGSRTYAITDRRNV